MPEYKLQQITEERLVSVAAVWESLAGEEEFAVELAPLFEWCGTHLVPSTHDAHALELVNSDTGSTDAILEVVNSHRGRLSKMLKIVVSPYFWAADRDLTVKWDAIELYAGAFVQVISDGIASGVDEVKIYGRSDQMLDILKSLEQIWNGHPVKRTGWSVTLAGRWLSAAPTI